MCGSICDLSVCCRFCVLQLLTDAQGRLCKNGVDEYLSAIWRIPDHQFINPSLKLTMARDYHNRRGREKRSMRGDAFVCKMKDAVESVQRLVTDIPGAAISKDLPSGKSLEDMINKLIVGKWLEDQKVRCYAS
jgi:hypothetical protein